MIVFGNDSVAVVTWGISIPLWTLSIYAIFAAFTVKESKSAFGTGINGGWLLAVVATQAVSTLGTLVSTRFLERK
jgi:hypothetical protein